MAKDVNIHVKAKGGNETKRQLDGVGRSAQKVGGDVKGMGEKARHGSNMFVAGLKKIAGPIGLAAVLAAVARTSVKIAQFFDNIKTRCDEAVRNIENVRAGFEGLYEAMSAFDEKSRQRVTKEAVALLKETSVTKQIGLPVIEAYARQFRGQVESGAISEEQYQRGLKGMLGYAERHGKEATPDLISLMAGWGMVTPEAQGAFRQQIATAAGMSGLEDAQVIGALGRGMPTIKAMGWTPEQAVQTIATLASGEVGRKKMSIPATTLQALMAPQVANLEKYGIPEEFAEDPQQLLALLTMKRSQMGPKPFLQMLTKIYGMEGAAGVHKLLSEPRADIGMALRRATGPVGAAEERAEELTSRQTLLRRGAKTAAEVLLRDMDVSIEEQYESHLRKIGEAERARRRRRRPVSQWLREFVTIGEEAEKEDALYQGWLESLSPEEKQQIIREEGYRYGPTQSFEKRWESMSPRERYEGVAGDTVINHYHNEMIYNPVAGTAADREMGPLAGNELKF